MLTLIGGPPGSDLNAVASFFCNASSNPLSDDARSRLGDRASSINAEILAEVGTTWLAPPHSRVNLAALALGRTGGRIRTAVQGVGFETEAFVADAKFSLTSKVWQDATERRPDLIVYADHPDLCAKQLALTHGVQPDFARFLWSVYVLSAAVNNPAVRILTPPDLADSKALFEEFKHCFFTPPQTPFARYPTQRDLPDATPASTSTATLATELWQWLLSDQVRDELPDTSIVDAILGSVQGFASLVTQRSATTARQAAIIGRSKVNELEGQVAALQKRVDELLLGKTRYARREERSAKKYELALDELRKDSEGGVLSLQQRVDELLLAESQHDETVAALRSELEQSEDRSRIAAEEADHARDELHRLRNSRVVRVGKVVWAARRFASSKLNLGKQD